MTDKCFIVGTGPSLKETEGLYQLASEDTFGVNRLILWEDLPFIPTYYAGNLTEVLSGYTPSEPECKKQRFIFYNPQDDLTTMPKGWVPVAKRMRYSLYDDEIVGLGDTLPPIPGGGTISMTVAQWALWMGYRQVYLVGVEQSEDKAPTIKAHSQGSLATNFIRWQAWEWLKEYCDDNGAEVHDCTPQGQLSMRKILPYLDLSEVLGC